MSEKILPRAEEITQKRKKHIVWKRFVKLMACVVVFCTTYALILPAITMEKINICGLEEHVHSDSCFIINEEIKPLVEETEETQPLSEDDIQPQPLSEETVEVKTLECTLEEHTHSDDCFAYLTSEGGYRVTTLNSMISQLPSTDEMDANLVAFEDANDMDGYEAYFTEIAVKAESAYAIYEVMDDDEISAVKDLDKLLDLEWTWNMQTYAYTDSVPIYGVNAYSAPSMIVKHGKNAADVHNGTNFKYWTATIIEVNNAGALYVSSIDSRRGDSYPKINYSATTAGGFVLFTHDYTPKAKVGDYVSVSFDYKNTSGTNSSGFGTVNFGTIGVLKPEKDNSNKLHIVESADTSELIEVNLYNYGSNINTLYNSNNKYPGYQQEGGETSGKNLYNNNFGNNVTEDRDAGLNGLTNKGGAINATTNSANSPISGAILGTLGTDGYPALADGTSLKYLFTTNTYATKRNTSNINGLFKYNEVTGEYTFNSRENHAQFNETTNTFTLYDEIITPNFTMYPFGNFLPFSDIVHDSAQVSAMNRNYLVQIQSSALYKAETGYDNSYTTVTPYATLAQSMSTWINKMDGKYGTNWSIAHGANEYFAYIKAIPDIDFTTNTALLNKAYCIDYDEPKNFYFGMEMNMEFMQPKNGLTGNDNAQPMVFEFSGDDDVWVYVDGKLFLDLSGIHRHVGGTIDFTNGIVTYSSLDPGTGDVGAPEKTVTFAEILGTTDGLNSKGTFEDYSTHTFNFYYMERGAGSGVCRMNFNFPLLHKNSISVGKDVTIDGNESTALGSPDFAFQVMKATNSGNKTDELFIGPETSYRLFDKDGKEIEGTYKTDEHGVFYIKAGQRAVFEGIEENQGKYYVRELFAPGFKEQYESVTVSGASTTTNQNVTVGSTNFVGVESPVQDMSNGSTLFQFQNEIDTLKYGNLDIKKELIKIDGTTTEFDKEFVMIVKLGNNLLPDGTKYEVNGKERTVVEPGEIIIKAGETAKIEKILAGSRFEVTEDSSSAEGYKVTYKVNGDASTSKSATGVINVNSTSSIIVENFEKGAHVDIQGVKRLLNPDGNEYEYVFTLTEVANLDGEPMAAGGTVKEETLTVSNEEEMQFNLYYLEKDLGGSQSKDYFYKVVESSASDDYLKADDSEYIVKVTVTSNDDGMTAKVTGIYKDGEEVKSIIFENTLLGTLIMQKIVEGASRPNAEFDFTLESSNLEGTYLASRNDAEIEGGITFVDGVATIKMIAGDVIKVTGFSSGTQITIKEDASGYQVTYKINDGDSIDGDTANVTIVTGDNSVVVTNDSGYELPKTGGIGTNMYTTGGLMLISIATVLLMYKKRIKKTS